MLRRLIVPLVVAAASGAILGVGGCAKPADPYPAKGTVAPPRPSELPPTRAEQRFEGRSFPSRPM